MSKNLFAKIVEKFLTKDNLPTDSDNSTEFKYNFILWFYSEFSWSFYWCLIYITCLSQFFTSPIICNGNPNIKAVDYDLIESYCFFGSNYFANNDIDIEEKQHFNYIYYWLIPIMVIMCIISTIPKFIMKQSKSFNHFQTIIIDSLENFRIKDQSLKEIVDTLNNHRSITIITVIWSIHLWIFISELMIIFLFSLIIKQTNTDDNNNDVETLLTYGFKWIIFHLSSSSSTTLFNGFSAEDPKTKLFPTIIPCIYRHYGHTGQLQQIDLLCTIKFNLLLSYLLLFIWFLVTITFVFIIIELFIIFMLLFPTIRFFYVYWTIFNYSLMKIIEKKRQESQRFILNYSTILMLRMLPINIGYQNTIKIIEKLMETDDDNE